MEKLNKDQLLRLSRKEINAIAKQNKIRGFNKLKKYDLIDAIDNPQVYQSSLAIKPKKVSSWTESMKEFNKDKSNYLIPKKGSVEYEAVRKIQMRLKNTSQIPNSDQSQLFDQAQKINDQVQEEKIKLKPTQAESKFKPIERPKFINQKTKQQQTQQPNLQSALSSVLLNSVMK